MGVYMDRIRQIPIFSRLSDENIKKLEKISYFKKYDADSILFYEGDEPGVLHVLVDGLLRLYKTDSKGHEIYIHQFIPTTLVGELANFENIKFPASSRFITKGEVLKIDYKKLEEDFFRNPEICMEIIRSLTNKVRILSNVIHHEMILTSEAKVAKFIKEHKNLFETVRNNQIAAILNVTPETLSRTLSKFKKDKLISIEKNHEITILNNEKITSLFED
jgi:CRP/FNR family transcriptional regulator